MERTASAAAHVGVALAPAVESCAEAAQKVLKSAAAHSEDAVSKEDSSVCSSSSLQRKPHRKAPEGPDRLKLALKLPAAEGVPKKSKSANEATVLGVTVAEREPYMERAGPIKRHSAKARDIPL